MRESALLSLYKLLYKLLIQAADTLSLILQNICELSYPLNPDAGGASAPSLFCPPWGFLLLITTFFGVKSPSCTSTIYLTLVLMSISVGLPIWHSVSTDTDNR